MEAKDIRKAHCLFEQSGTFKNEFIKLGIPAEDYDIQNHFNQTDHVIDLFGEIEKAYTNRTEQNNCSSVFDGMSSNDIVIAFFPCIYFETRQMTYYFEQQAQTEDGADKGRNREAGEKDAVSHIAL